MLVIRSSIYILNGHSEFIVLLSLFLSFIYYFGAFCILNGHGEFVVLLKLLKMCARDNSVCHES
ncbi:hypothetical protein Scep_015222 [Stephania cephalantha]|uniref:Uncharacterized protein n=1 Tax=Stephania cephalantha TaxID=152367 RepID=A0AAP0J5B6_9MAGN